MKSKPFRLLALCVVLIAIAAGACHWLFPSLPIVKLPDGREVRVLQVGYGTGERWEHDLVRPPNWKLRVRAFFSHSSPDTPNYISVWMVMTKPGEVFDRRKATETPWGGTDGVSVNRYAWRNEPAATWKEMTVVHWPSGGAWQGELRQVKLYAVSREARELRVPVNPNDGLHAYHYTAKVVPEYFAADAPSFTIPNPAYHKP